MTTLGALVEHTRHLLSGADSSTDTVAALAAPVDATATTLNVEVDELEASALPTGVVEIDFEQMRAKSSSGQDGTVTLWPFGRGYRGTTAATHAAGAEVRFGPEWPASTIAREINGVLTELYPALYAVHSTDTTVPSDGGWLTVPDEDAVAVSSVWVRDDTLPDQWVRWDRWSYSPQVHAHDATTRALRLGGGLTPGATVRVFTIRRPKLFTEPFNASEDFTTVTGLDARLTDLIALGVARRLAPFADVARLQSVSATAADPQAKPPNAGLSAVRTLHSLYLSRLEQEAAVLAKEHPIHVHLTR